MFEKMIAGAVMAAVVAGSFYLFGESSQRPLAVVAATPQVEDVPVQALTRQAMADTNDYEYIIEAQ